MKAVEATVTLMALAALAPATAFAPSAATGTAIRRSRGEYVPAVPTGTAVSNSFWRQSIYFVRNCKDLSCINIIIKTVLTFTDKFSYEPAAVHDAFFPPHFKYLEGSVLGGTTPPLSVGAATPMHPYRGAPPMSVGYETSGGGRHSSISFRAFFFLVSSSLKFFCRTAHCDNDTCAFSVAPWRLYTPVPVDILHTRCLFVLIRGPGEAHTCKLCGHKLRDRATAQQYIADAVPRKRQPGWNECDVPLCPEI